MSSSVKVTFINNDGAGFADVLEVAAGTTVGQLFEEQLGDADPASYLIRVNREPTASDRLLADGDRVSCTPSKIDGA